MANIKNEQDGFLQYSEIEQEIDTILKDEESNDFRTLLKKTGNEYLKSQHEPKHFFINRRAYVYAIAASITIIVGVLGITRYLAKSSGSNYDAIFNEYYQTYQSDFASRSDEVVVNNLYLAFQSFESKDYDKAVELFSRVINSDESISMAFFYRGVSCIETGDYKLAVSSFNKLIENTTNPYYPQAKWYLALTWIKLNNPDEAISNLEWLVSNDRYYGIKAKEILKKIKKRV